MASPLNPFNLGLFNSGTYTPGVLDLSNVTKANPATVTTTADHNYVVSQEVQFFIPKPWGMRQLNTLTGYVLSVPTSTTFTVNIDTSNFDAFVVPIPPTFVVYDPAQVAAIGDANTGKSSVNGVLQVPQTIPGAYINTFP